MARGHLFKKLLGRGYTTQIYHVSNVWLTSVSKVSRKSSLAKWVAEIPIAPVTSRGVQRP